MYSYATLAFCLNVVYCSEVGVVTMPDDLTNEIKRTFPGVTNETLLVDFLSNATYVETLMSITLQMCYIDALETHRQKRNIFTDLFPKDFWVKDVHHGWYHYLKHLDPIRWYHEAFDFLEIKSSLPPLYYAAKYFPEEIRFLKAMNDTEDFYPNVTWPPGLDPLWTGDPNKTTNLFTLLTESSSSESQPWEPYSGESTTTEDPSRLFWRF